MLTGTLGNRHLKVICFHLAIFTATQGVGCLYFSCCSRMKTSQYGNYKSYLYAGPLCVALREQRPENVHLHVSVVEFSFYAEEHVKVGLMAPVAKSLKWPAEYDRLY